MAKTIKEKNQEKIDKYESDVKLKRDKVKNMMRTKFADPIDPPRVHLIARDCAQHGVNHPEKETGLLRDKLAKLEALEAARNASDKLLDKHKNKYQQDILDLKELLAELDADNLNDPEPIEPVLEPEE